jgi:hypothetical protein
MKKEQTYVGELIRKEIKDAMVTNGYVIKGLDEMGVKLTPTNFSNKIYGVRDKFTESEVQLISKILKKSFNG